GGLALAGVAEGGRLAVPLAVPHHGAVPGPVARHLGAALVARRVRVHLELAPEGRPRAVVALGLDAVAARVRTGAPVTFPHHDEVPGPVARRRRLGLEPRRVRVHLELAPDGRPRAVVALALDAAAARVRPGAPVARPHHDEVPGPVARYRRAEPVARRVRVHLELAPEGRDLPPRGSAEP